MAAGRRRLSPADRRAELLALGAEVFGQRPYDDVRMDEIAERAGVSRALMYHYFPDKRTFFAAVIRAESELLFDATDAADEPGQSLFGRLRAGVMAYLRYDEEHPYGAWAAYIGIGRTDPVLRGLEAVDTDRQSGRIMSVIESETSEPLGENARRLLRATVYSWLAFTFEFCRRHVLDPSMDADTVADACAYSLLDAIARIPDVPAELKSVAALSDAVGTMER